jgi:thiosulfate/3-mercaptopyruvate sulfurtransferase
MLFNNNNSPLVSASELNEVLGDESLKVFDIRGKWGDPPTSFHDDYLQGHIPGAIYLDWTQRFLTQDMPIGLAPVASKEQAQKDFEMLGISANDTVVLYDDYHHMLAGRLWWAMHYWGFSNVKVLNGGWKHWSSSNFPISTEQSTPAKGHFDVNEQASLRVDTKQVRVRDGQTHLIDARGPINFAGDPSDKATGHIPRAVNVPYSSLLDETTGLFKDDESLEAVVSQRLDIQEGDAVISSCGSGYAGTVMLIALKQLGIDASLYDGSFSEWKRQPNALIEQGSSVHSA